MNSIDERHLAPTIEGDDNLPAQSTSHAQPGQIRLPTVEASMTDRSDTRSPTVSWASQRSGRSTSIQSTALSSVSENVSEEDTEEEEKEDDLTDAFSVDGDGRISSGNAVQRDFDVESVLEKRVENGVVWYKVRWKPTRVANDQVDLNAEGQWTVELDGGTWGGVFGVRSVDVNTCEVAWQDSERPVWRLGRAMSRIAEWHESNPEELDANEPQFWLGYKTDGMPSTMSYQMPADTGFFIGQRRRKFQPVNIDYTMPLLKYCLRRATLSPHAVRLLNSPVQRPLVFSRDFIDSGKEIDLRRANTFKALLAYCVGEARGKSCSRCASGKSAFPACVYHGGVLEGVCAGCAVRGGGCETSCECHNSHRIYHDGAGSHFVRPEETSTPEIDNEAADGVLTGNGAENSGQDPTCAQSENMTRSTPGGDQGFLDPAPAAASDGDEYFFDSAPDTAPDHEDEGLPDVHRFHKPYPRTLTEELYSSTPRPLNVSQAGGFDRLVDDRSTRPTSLQQITASRAPETYSTPPTQPLQSSQRQTPEAPSDSGDERLESASQSRFQSDSGRIKSPEVFIRKAGAFGATSPTRTISLVIRSTPAPHSSSTVRGSLIDASSSQAGSEDDSRLAFHTPPRSAIELQQLEGPRLAFLPVPKASIKPDAKPVGKQDADRKQQGKKRSAPDPAQEGAKSSEGAKQGSSNRDSHQPKRTRTISASLSTKSEVSSTTQSLFLNAHRRCTPGKPCLDPIAGFPGYAGSRPPLVYNDREFEKWEATIDEVRYVVSQCQCENAEILSKLARGSFGKLFQRGDLELGERYSMEGELAGRFWRQLNQAVQVACPVREKGKGKGRKKVVDLT
ncbi:hypothetical protein BST61_g10225 [Cercospora zeina]